MTTRPLLQKLYDLSIVQYQKISCFQNIEIPDLSTTTQAIMTSFSFDQWHDAIINSFQNVCTQKQIKVHTKKIEMPERITTDQFKLTVLIWNLFVQKIRDLQNSACITLTSTLHGDNLVMEIIEPLPKQNNSPIPRRIRPFYGPEIQAAYGYTPSYLNTAFLRTLHCKLEVSHSETTRTTAVTIPNVLPLAGRHGRSSITT